MINISKLLSYLEVLIKYRIAGEKLTIYENRLEFAVCPEHLVDIVLSFWNDGSIWLLQGSRCARPLGDASELVIEDSKPEATISVSGPADIESTEELEHILNLWAQSNK